MTTWSRRGSTYQIDRYGCTMLAHGWTDGTPDIVRSRSAWSYRVVTNRSRSAFSARPAALRTPSAADASDPGTTDTTRVPSAPSRHTPPNSWGCERTYPAMASVVAASAAAAPSAEGAPAEGTAPAAPTVPRSSANDARTQPPVPATP